MARPARTPLPAGETVAAPSRSPRAPTVRTSSVIPWAVATSISCVTLASQAAVEYGTTMPVVPRMEMPPTMPRRGLNVFFASSSPRPRTDISTATPPTGRAKPVFGQHLLDRLGDQLARCRVDGRLTTAAPAVPFLVTSPTPTPAAPERSRPARSPRVPASRSHAQVRYIRIVTRILDHAGSAPSLSVKVHEWRGKGDRPARRAGEWRTSATGCCPIRARQRAPGRGGRACPRGVPRAQVLPGSPSSRHPPNWRRSQHACTAIPPGSPRRSRPPARDAES